MSDNLIIFTHSNTIISVNNNPLGLVQSIDMEDLMDDSGNKYSQITLSRLVYDREEIVNDMRSTPFLFKISNSATGGGYIAPDAEVIGFKMKLSVKKDMNPIEFLEQTIVIKAKSFVYVSDARSKEMKTIEEEDSANLIRIIKEHQAKYGNKAVLPKEEPVVELKDIKKTKKRA